MFESILIGMSGLQGFSKGLKVISNNVANLNTPGFKSANLNFTDAYYQQSNQGGGYALGESHLQYGTGLTTLATRLNFQQGDTRQTGNQMDISIAGEGFLVVEDQSNTPHYTRAGQLQFDKDGNLVTTTGNRYVMGFVKDSNGTSLSRITLAGLKTNPAHATTAVKFNGNLSNTATEFTLDTVKVIDAVGGEHTLKLNFKNKNSTDAGTWTVTVMDGTTTVGSGDIKFINGMPDPTANSFTFSFTPEGGAAMDVKLDFANDVTSFAAGTTSTLAVSSQDGYAAGTISSVAFDSDGTLALTYSNGQTAKGSQLALAMFESNLGLSQSGSAEFTADGTQAAVLGRPGQRGLGTVHGGQLELSNVDLSAEFGDLIVMQRGYQASSRVVTTANEMLQELFEMKGR